MLKFEDFCKQLKTKDDIINGIEFITYFNEHLIPGSSCSIRKDSSNWKIVYKRIMERFYDEIYLKQFNNK